MKTIIIASCILLSGCLGVQFDSLEFDRFVKVTHYTKTLVKSCDQPDFISVSMSTLKEDVYHMVEYQRYLARQKEVFTSVSSLYSQIEEFENHYKDQKQPSLMYCEEKLKLISSGAEAIAKTLGRL